MEVTCVDTKSFVRLLGYSKSLCSNESVVTQVKLGLVTVSLTCLSPSLFVSTPPGTSVYVCGGSQECRETTYSYSSDGWGWNLKTSKSDERICDRRRYLLTFKTSDK